MSTINTIPITYVPSYNQNATEHIQWQTYVDVANDIKPYLQMPATETARDSTLGLFADMSCQWVQRYLGQPMCPTEFNFLFDGWTGWQGAYIELPYYPVLEIKAVNEVWGTSGTHWLSEQTPTNQVTGWQCEYRTGRLTRVFPGLVQRPWFPGSKNIHVIWVAGRNPVPADIRVATLELIAHWWRNTQQAVRTTLKAGGTDSQATNKGLWQGVPYRITSLLSPYEQIGLG